MSASTKLCSLCEMLDEVATIADRWSDSAPLTRNERTRAASLSIALHEIKEPLSRVLTQVEKWRSQLPDGKPIRNRRGRGAALADLADALASTAEKSGITL